MRVVAGVAFVAAGAGVCVGQEVGTGQKAIDLPTSKQISRPVPGQPQRLNSLPISMAVSPDGRWVVTVNAGYGTWESGYMQSLAVVDTRTGAVTDSPDERTMVEAGQTLYSGLAFSADGRHLYGTVGSLTDPEGKKKGDTGNGIVVYGFADGRLTRERVLKIGLQALAGGRRTSLVGDVSGALGVPFPAGVAVVPGAGPERLLVADNLSDDVLLMNAGTGEVVTRFDLSESDAVPGTYPLAVAVSKDGRRGFATLWNASEVVELDLEKGVVGRRLPLLKPQGLTVAGTHPCAMEFSPDGKTLYVALANRDAVAAVDVAAGKGGRAAEFAVKGYFDTRLPGQSYFGAEPEALAVSADGRRLYVGNGAQDAIAVMDTARLTAKAAKKGFVEPIGFVPTEWMPMSMGMAGGRLYVATAKGKGTGPNNYPLRQTERTRGKRAFQLTSTYIGTLLYGSVATLDVGAMERELPRWTAEVLEDNRMRAAAEVIRFAGGGGGAAVGGGGREADPPPVAKDDKRSVGSGGVGFPGPIRHVIYIIKENRTYDQLFGDLEQGGHPVGNGDKSLTMYGAAITPNQHKLALQFGVLDNFFDSGEVSGDGHVWSTAAIGTDYLEKTWEQNYRGGQRTYDFEGVVSEGYPIDQHIPDVNEPASGYLWGNLQRHGRTLYHFGEYISTSFCDEKKSGSSQEGPMLEGVACERPTIKPGGAIPAEWGGGVSPFQWEIPLIAKNVATKPELVGHFAVEGPDFNVKVPDQIRVEVFLRHFAEWKRDKEAGRDTMPNFVMLRLPSDHTAGTRAGSPMPKASIADNDLAIGRAVEAVSHSGYWDDTAFFILEDDAQNGADHVDAHRSLALVISKYAQRGKDGGAYVDSRFYSTVSMIRTMEAVLGLPPMNNNDAFSSLMAPEFEGPGDQPPFVADVSNRENGLIYRANPKVTAAMDPVTAEGERESAKMDFRHADRADARKLNVILWRDAMGEAPVPALVTEKRKKAKKDDDD